MLVLLPRLELGLYRLSTCSLCHLEYSSIGTHAWTRTKIRWLTATPPTIEGHEYWHQRQDSNPHAHCFEGRSSSIELRWYGTHYPTRTDDLCLRRAMRCPTALSRYGLQGGTRTLTPSKALVSKTSVAADYTTHRLVPPAGLEPAFACLKGRCLSPFGQGGIGGNNRTRTCNLDTASVLHSRLCYVPIGCICRTRTYAFPRSERGAVPTWPRCNVSYSIRACEIVSTLCYMKSSLGGVLSPCGTSGVSLPQQGTVIQLGSRLPENSLRHPVPWR